MREYIIMIMGFSVVVDDRWSPKTRNGVVECTHVFFSFNVAVDKYYVAYTFLHPVAAHFFWSSS